MQKSKNAFTMIEVVFVIVILGILAAVAIPRLAATRTDAEITKGRADIASIRSAIVSERQGRLIRGNSDWITVLSENTTTLFDGNGSSELLMYGIAAGTGDGHWQSDSGTVYTYTVQGTAEEFTYTPADGKFTCVTTNATCKLLTD